MPLASDHDPSRPTLPGFLRRWWWLVALVLVVLPLALVVYLLLSTPDVQPFEYKVR